MIHLWFTGSINLQIDAEQIIIPTITFNFEIRFRLFIFFEGEKVAFNQSKGKVAGNIGKINGCSPFCSANSHFNQVWNH